MTQDTKVDWGDEARFWSQVEVKRGGDCWLWTGRRSRQQKGWEYGSFWMQGKHHRAHHVALMLSGKPRSDGQIARHHCDVPLCVNPKHLAWGTQSENVADMMNRGRNVAPQGSAHGNSKLTEDQIADIRNRFASGETKTDIARDFNVSRYAIYWIIKKGWNHVPRSLERADTLTGQSVRGEG